MKKELIKIGLISSLAISLLGLALEFINRQAVSMIASHLVNAEELSLSFESFDWDSIETALETTRLSEALSWEFIVGRETVFIEDNTQSFNESGLWLEDVFPDTHHLNIEEAVEATIHQIFQIYAPEELISFEGLTFNMIFRNWAQGQVWQGIILGERPEGEFFFILDAISGELIELQRNTPETPIHG